MESMHALTYTHLYMHSLKLEVCTVFMGVVQFSETQVHRQITYMHVILFIYAMTCIIIALSHLRHSYEGHWLLR